MNDYQDDDGPQHYIPTAEMSIDGPISCLSFSPEDDDTIIVGTYELQGDEGEKAGPGAPQIRKGKICVFNVNEEFKIRHVEQTEYGILHISFSQATTDNFAVATSVGRIEIFELNLDDLRVKRIQSFVIASEAILVLYLDWCPPTTGVEQSQIALSLSDGRIGVLQFQEEKIHELNLVQAHSLEAWYIAWNPLDTARLFSGGDDAWFCISSADMQRNDRHAEGTEEISAERDCYKPIYCNKKMHQAGVTSILPYQKVINGDQIVFTGSYDEYLRVLRRKQGTSNWQVMLETRLGGGVWRLQVLENPHAEERPMEKWSLTMLVSCMHEGPKLMAINFDGSTSTSAKVLADCREHSSMNYATDARSVGRYTLKVVSSSFYDKKLCLWHAKQRLSGA